MTSSIEVVISPRANRDVRQILAYTEKQWGTGQRDVYQGILDSAFRRIGDFPELGKAVVDGPPRLRELVLRHHTIVYLGDPDRVTILRVRGHRRRRS